MILVSQGASHASQCQSGVELRYRCDDAGWDVCKGALEEKEAGEVFAARDYLRSKGKKSIARKT